MPFTGAAQSTVTDRAGMNPMSLTNSTQGAQPFGVTSAVICAMSSALRTGPFGPVITTGVDPMKLSIRTILNGKEVQNYPVADMFFPPHKLVAMVSRDMTLFPGDVISCGTSLGAGPMPAAENVVEVTLAVDENAPCVDATCTVPGCCPSGTVA